MTLTKVTRPLARADGYVCMTTVLAPMIERLLAGDATAEAEIEACVWECPEQVSAALDAMMVNPSTVARVDQIRIARATRELKLRDERVARRRA